MNAGDKFYSPEEWVVLGEETTAWRIWFLSRGDFCVKVEHHPRGFTILVITASCHPQTMVTFGHDGESLLPHQLCGVCMAPTRYRMENLRSTHLYSSQVERWAQAHHDSMEAALVVNALTEKIEALIASAEGR